MVTYDERSSLVIATDLIMRMNRAMLMLSKSSVAGEREVADDFRAQQKVMMDIIKAFPEARDSIKMEILYEFIDDWRGCPMFSCIFPKEES